MFFQTVLQNLMMKKRAKKQSPTDPLSPMAQSIMQKLAEIDKNPQQSQDADISPSKTTQNK